MKRSKIIILVVIIMGLVSIFSFFFLQGDIRGDLNPKNINFVISPNHTEFLKGEYIWINVKIVNNSDQTYFIKGNLVSGGGLEFIIKDAQGKIIPKPSFQSFKIEREDSLTFLPNDTLENIQNLEWFNLGYSKSTNEYSLVAKYNNFTSNEIYFKVIEPEGSEKKLYDFIQKYDNERVFKKENGEYLDNEAISLINQFPDSRYSPILYEQLLSIMMGYYPGSNNFERYFDDYMLKHSNDPTTSIMINLYSAKLKLLTKDKNFIKSKLEELKSKYGNNLFLNNEIDRYIRRNVDNEIYWFKK